MDITAYAPPAANQIKKVDSDSALTGLKDFGAFLKLFVAQLQNQDPLKPSDGTELFSQTAQITQVEQLLQMNKDNAKAQASLDTLSRSLSSAYLGKIVTGQVEEGSGADAKKVEVTGQVIDVTYDKDGIPILGLNTGKKMPLSAVTNVTAVFG